MNMILPAFWLSHTMALSALALGANPEAASVDSIARDVAAAIAAEQPRIVALGEATHGVSEFQTVRLRITEELLNNHGFAAVALEDALGWVVRLPGASTLLVEGRPSDGIYYQPGYHELMGFLKDRKDVAFMGIDTNVGVLDTGPARLTKYGVSASQSDTQAEESVRRVGGGDMDVAFVLRLRRAMKLLDSARNRRSLDRDALMADNIAWLERTVGPVIVLAHTGHIVKRRSRVGGILDAKYGDRYAAVGVSAVGGCTSVWDDGSRQIALLEPPPRSAVESRVAVASEGSAVWVSDDVAGNPRRTLMVGVTSYPRHHQRVGMPVLRALDHVVVLGHVHDSGGTGCDVR